MLKFEELVGQEATFRFPGEEPVADRMWATDRMNNALDDEDIDRANVKWIQTDMLHALQFIIAMKMKVEDLEYLRANTEPLARPLIIVNMEDGSGDVMVDGYKRYVVLDALNMPIAPIWYVTEQWARNFEIENPPAVEIQPDLVGRASDPA